MGKFKNEISISRVGSKHWKLNTPLKYTSTAGDVYTVPNKNFKFDGASIPRLLWSIVGHPLNGKHVRAAALHDYLYTTKLVTRKEADLLFLEALEADEVSKLRRTLMYYGVRLGGHWCW